MKDFGKMTLRLECSRRGGGVEISLNSFGYKGEKMTAYQNYLGGGMLGSICNDCTIPGWEQNNKLMDIADELAKYFHSITNEEVVNYDEWAAGSYEKVQSRSSSAY